MRVVRPPLLLFLLTCCHGCAIPADSRGPAPIMADVFHWKVVDETTSAVLSQGCGKDVNERAAQIQFAAPAGARVIETVLYETVQKSADRPSYPQSGNVKREDDDAYWCSTTDDVSRVPAAFKGDIQCARPTKSAPANIVTREVIPRSGAMGGYRLVLEILRPGTLRYEPEPGCPFGWYSELTVLP